MDVELTNNEEWILAKRGVIPQDDVRSCVIDGWVDTGATRVVIPKFVADSLGLKSVTKTGVKFADGLREQRDVVGNLRLKVCDRESVFRAIVEPGREDVLIGAIVLEDLDLLADPRTQTCYPRDPEQLLTEAEGFDTFTPAE